MLRDDAHLLDILNAARRAIQFKGSAGKAEFLGDANSQSAVLHQLLRTCAEIGLPAPFRSRLGRNGTPRLMIVGEAVKRISPEFRAEHPEVPWKLITGTRDKLIHFLRERGSG